MIIVNTSGLLIKIGTLASAYNYGKIIFDLRIKSAGLYEMSIKPNIILSFKDNVKRIAAFVRIRMPIIMNKI